MTSTMASSTSSSKSEFLVNGKYRLIRKIGSGSFGDIYLGINVSNGEVSCIVVNLIHFVCSKRSSRVEYSRLDPDLCYISS